MLDDSSEANYSSFEVSGPLGLYVGNQVNLNENIFFVGGDSYIDTVWVV